MKYEGVFVSYRGGKSTQRNKQALIRIEGINNSSEAALFIGKKIVWKRLVGKIVNIHGKNGLVRVAFKKGLPGQALGSRVEVK